MAFANLLAPAGIIQADNLDGHRVGKVGHRRVVEGNVSVFADTDETHVDRSLGEEGAVAAALRLQIGGVAVHIMHSAERNAVRQPSLQPQPETRRVRGLDTGILIQMERFDRTPVDVPVQHEGVDEVELGVARAYHHARAQAAVDRAAQNRGRRLCCCH